jgi:hypothetical protein
VKLGVDDRGGPVNCGMFSIVPEKPAMELLIFCTLLGRGGVSVGESCVLGLLEIGVTRLEEAQSMDTSKMRKGRQGSSEETRKRNKILTRRQTHRHRT